MKKKYEKPVVEIELFEIEDIITVSNADEGTGLQLEYIEIIN